MTDNTTLPPMDDSVSMSSTGQTEDALLDAVLRNSDFTKDAYEPLPEMEENEVDPVESDIEEDPEESDETVTEEGYEEEEVEDTDEDATATQEAEYYTADDLDLDAKVRVKIDGEEVDVSFADLLKGYQTDASISKKGRELGEARKALEEERNKAMLEVQEIGQASAAILMGTEQNLAKEYHELDKAIDKAREDGDTYELNELKDKREQAQKRYWAARKQREGLQQQLQQQQQKVSEELWQKQLEYFNNTIQEEVPDFNEETAMAIREFAISEGIPEEVVNTIADPVVVRILNDYRKLKQGVTKGEAKRKAVPAKKAVPTKKGKTEQKQKADRQAVIKQRAFDANATQDDQMAFLRDYAANSLNLK